MVYATVPKEDKNNLTGDRLTALSLYLSEVVYPRWVSAE